MIDSLAGKIAVALKNTNQDETPSVAVMKFALIVVINTALTVFLSLTISLILGSAIDTLIVLCFFGLLHFFSGGYHFKSAMTCTIVSTLTFVLIPHIPISRDIAYVLTLCSLILILIFAPSNIKNAARIPEKYFPLLKLISIIIVISTVFFSLHLLALTYFIQSLTLIKFKKEEVTK